MIDAIEKISILRLNRRSESAISRAFCAQFLLSNDVIWAGKTGYRGGEARQTLEVFSSLFLCIERKYGAETPKNITAMTDDLPR